MCRVYMCQWNGSALVQLMACHIFGAKPLHELYWIIVSTTLMNKLDWHLNQNTKLFIDENAFENNSWEMATILFREWWFKALTGVIQHWNPLCQIGIKNCDSNFFVTLAPWCIHIDVSFLSTSFYWCICQLISVNGSVGFQPCPMTSTIDGNYYINNRNWQKYQ